MKTKREIDYHTLPYGGFTIPKGTPVTEATNLPNKNGEKRYWVEPWKGMSDEAESWQWVYGFLVEAGDVTDDKKPVTN